MIFFCISTKQVHIVIYYFIQNRTIKTVPDSPLNCVEEFTYLGSKISSCKNDVNTDSGKIWSVVNKLSLVWRSGLPDHMKRNIFLTTVTSVLLYGCSIWTISRKLERRLDGVYIRILKVALNVTCLDRLTNGTLSSVRLQKRAY